MDKSAKRRQEIVQAAAMHLIQHGLHTSGLRAIARSVGISDRMIMYYFETKEDLVSEALLLIGEQMAASTEAAIPRGNASAKAILDTLTESLRSDEVRAVMRLWFEIIGLAMRGQDPYRRTAEHLLARSEAQIRSKLRSDQKHKAPEVLAALEGSIMLDLLSHRD